MTWLLVAIFAYLILAAVFLVDRYLLAGPFPDPKVYAFYVGTLGLLVLFIAPFVGFYVPEKSQIALSLSAGFVFVYGLFWFYKTLRLFEPSRVVPAVGGLTPLFTFWLIYIFSGGKETLSFSAAIAFLLLIAGSVLINLRKEKLITFQSFQLSVLTAFLFSLSFVLIKYVYLVQPFWNGFIWRNIGGFLTAICFFIFWPEVRRAIFEKKERFSEKTAIIFLVNQAAGGGAAILQNFAIFLAPLVYLPVIHALNGSQYIFLFIFATLLSLKFPKILKEEISKEIIFQKIIAILLIGAGLAVLAFL